MDKIFKAYDMRGIYPEEINEDIAKKHGCSSWLVSEISRRNLTKEERKIRWTKLARLSKYGDKNPMYGKCGEKHHNHTKKEVRMMGYRTVFPPTWWKGTISKGRVYEHIIKWAEANGYDHLPKGHVIHHIDENIDNNSPENLVLMTISDHIKLHWQLRKVQRLERNLVGDSVSEAHSNQ